MKIKILTIIYGIAIAGTLYFVAISFNYLGSYLSEPDNPLRHESAEGAAIALILSMPFWVVACGAIQLIKSVISRAIFLRTIIITGLIFGVFIGANIYSVIVLVIDK